MRVSEIVRVPEIEELFPKPSNYEEIKQDVAARGVQESIVVNDNDQLLCGYTRLSIAEELGLESVIVRRENISDLDDMIEYAILDNIRRRQLTDLQLVEYGMRLEAIYSNRQGQRTDLRTDCPEVGQTRDLIANQIQEETGVKMSGRKYDRLKTIAMKAIQNVKDKLNEGEITQEEALELTKLEPEKQVEIITSGRSIRRAHQMIKQEEAEQKAKEKREASPVSAKIIRGDCVQLLDKIEDNSYDCLFTDPLYITDVEDFEGFTASWLPRAFSKIKTTGRAFIFCSSDAREIAIYQQQLSLISDFTIGNLLIWYYENTIGPKPTHTFKNNWQGVFYLYGKDATPLDSPLLKEQFSVFEYSAPDGRTQIKYHTYQKPKALIQHLLAVSTQEGDKVLDLFAGSGSIGIASAESGRPSLSIEKNSEYVEICKQRGLIGVTKIM